MSPLADEPRRRLPGHLIVLAVAALVAAVAIGVLAARLASTRRAPGTTPSSAQASLPPGIAGRPAPDIRLTDANSGRVLDTRALRGRPYAVTFLYTHCPDVCPLIGAELRQALLQLGPEADRVAVVAVTVDPARDTPTAVRSWLRVHRQPPNFHYLIGTPRELRPVWKAYFAAPQIPGDPQSSHTAAIWFIDAQGRRQANFNAGAPVNADALAHEFRVLLEHT
jgi:protein SCO1/2